MILKIVNGKLDLLNDHGGKLRTIAEKNVVDAALSNDEKQILITYRGRKSTIAESNVVKAIFHGTDVLITLKNGDMELRNQYGGKIRSI